MKNAKISVSINDYAQKTFTFHELLPFYEFITSERDFWREAADNINPQNAISIFLVLTLILIT